MFRNLLERLTPRPGSRRAPHARPRSRSRLAIESLEDRAVTIRERDSMQQARVPVAELAGAIAERLGF